MLAHDILGFDADHDDAANGPAYHLRLVPEPALKLYEEFHPYGTSAYRAVDSTIGVSAKRYRYAGLERDEETGLDQMGARYYAPWLGRWTAADPIGLGDGVNRYAYVSGNPVGMLDPSGTEGLTAAQREIAEASALIDAVAAAHNAVGHLQRELAAEERVAEKHRAQTGENPELLHLTGLEHGGPRSRYVIDDRIEALFWPSGVPAHAVRASRDSGACFRADDGDYTDYYDEAGRFLGRTLKEEGGPALEASVPGDLAIDLVAGGLIGAGRRAFLFLGRSLSVAPAAGESTLSTTSRAAGDIERTLISEADYTAFGAEMRELGVSVVRGGAETEAELAARNADALYMPSTRSGSPGTIYPKSQPSEAEVFEEAIHARQDFVNNFVNPSSGAEARANAAYNEVDAALKLRAAGRERGWTAEEMAHTADNLRYWQDQLSAATTALSHWIRNGGRGL